MKVKYIRELRDVKEITEDEVSLLSEVSKKFAFRTNSYYNSLIDWSDPNDPIRKIVIPSTSELNEWGKLDASDESKYTVEKGVEHKYRDTALLLVSDVCGIYCRFCFRKRLFMPDNDEVSKDISAGIKYIKNHTEINNVLLTGGDPLILSTRRIKEILSELSSIEHIKIVRIGTKMLAANPFRIIEDKQLHDVFRWFNGETGKKLYIMNHFNHPREITSASDKAVRILHEAGAVLLNQTPILKGINDDEKTLSQLLEKLSFMGVSPYYLFQCRPTIGNDGYSTEIESTIDIVESAKSKVSGLANRVKYVMSHESGKIEILGKTEKFIFFKYHRAANPSDEGKFMVFKRNPQARWFDDYTELVDEYKVNSS